MSKRRPVNRDNYFDSSVTADAVPDDFVNALVPAAMDAVGYGGQSLPVVRRPGGIIQVGNFLLSNTGLTSEVEVSRDEWVAFYEGVRLIKRRLQWIIGDWMLYGAERGYVNSYEEMAEMTGLSVGTVKVYTSVCRSIPPLIRINKLSFAHFQLIAPLPDDDKATWIQRAIDEKMSVRELRKAINHEDPDPPPPLTKKETNLLTKFLRAVKTNRQAEIPSDEIVYMRKALERALSLLKR